MGSLNSGILSMPVDVLAIVVSKLSFQDLLILGMTCRTLYSVASSDIVWMDKCKVWEKDVKLQDWRRAASSARALFRLLRNLSKFKGVWSSQDHYPRGCLVYLTWGNFALGGWKVVPESLTRVSFVPLFEVMGLVDGSTKVELVSTTSESRLPVALKWLSHGVFQLQVSETGDLSERRRDWTAFELTKKDLLLHGFELGSEDDIDQQAEGFGIRTIQYLKRLTASRNGRTTTSSDITFTFRRVELEPNPEQMLTGLWCGIYGPHGLEIVAVQYNNDLITALKIIGDPNVPCNKVSFEVRSECETKNIAPELQRLANMLTVPGRIDPAAKIVAVYKGSGKIAGFNYRNPEWVPGKLLVHENGGFSFLWEDVNFVIRFQRLELQSLFNSVGDEPQVSSQTIARDSTKGLYTQRIAEARDM